MRHTACHREPEEQGVTIQPDCFVAALLQMNSPRLSLRRSLGDGGNPREQSISWIATSLRF
jgi:hypothetical protein